VNRGSEPIAAPISVSAAVTFKSHLQVAKVPLCLLVAFSAFFGYALAAHNLGLQAWLVFGSVLLLACGGASLNSYQEHRWDRLMQRTKRRPVAAGLVSPELARRQGQLLAASGLLLLLIGTSRPLAVCAGAAALVLYNFVYTPLKYKSIWAIIPGAICGALPPYIGWLAGQGPLFSPVILGGVLLLVIWQIPHFWLVMLSNKRDYHESPLPSLSRMVSESRLQMLIVLWVGALITVLHTLLAMFTTTPLTIRIMISGVSLVVLVVFSLQMGISKQPHYRFLFVLLNSFMLLTMALLTVGAIVA
jgi:protoheme IX farnesyltransferase